MGRAKLTYHHGDLKGALISAAAEMITTQGQAGFSLRKVAQQVGVSQTALYRHFANKEELFAAVAEQSFLRLSEKSRQAFDSHNDLTERTIEVGMAYLDFAAENPNLYRLMFDSAIADNQRYPALADARRQAFKYSALNSAAMRRLRDPDIAPDSLEAESTKILSQALVHGLASLMIEGMIHSRVERQELMRKTLSESLRSP